MTIFWKENTPYSTSFDDMYYQARDGQAESHYVFIEGNDLEKRWAKLFLETKRNFEKSEIENTPTVFSLGELGFGTGLNFSLSAKLFLELNEKTQGESMPLMHYYTCEKYPLAIEEILRAQHCFPELEVYFSEWLKGYSVSLLKNTESSQYCCHELWGGRIILHLYIGEVLEFLKVLVKSNVKIEAWYMDGFSPKKNPEMWTLDICKEMFAASSKNTTLATFSSAGSVKRCLIEAGWFVSKVKGFGKKREMLLAKFPDKI